MRVTLSHHDTHCPHCNEPLPARVSITNDGEDLVHADLDRIRLGRIHAAHHASGQTDFEGEPWIRTETTLNA